jgi:hypothetical protein
MDDTSKKNKTNDEEIEEAAETPAEEKTEDDLAKIADRLVTIAAKQYDAAVKYRQPKLEKIMKAEELYFNVVTRTLKGRFNVPLPIVSGFVDTLLAKIDDEITINFDAQEDADKIKCRKCTAAIKYDSAPTRGMWAIKDILMKKLAIFAGRTQAAVFSASDPKYKNFFEIVDLFDFLCEPEGGWFLENHLFCGRENIFRTKYDLENGSQYDQGQVAKLITAVGTKEFKDANDLFLNRLKRHQNLGLDQNVNNYVGVDLYNLAEWNMYDTVTGKRYYLFFEPRARIWTRIVPLEEITGEPEEGELPKYMFKSWATHPDAWNYLSKAPVDDVVPVAVAMKTITNFMFDDVQKRLWGQRIYDPEIITDPSQLEWDRPDKLIMATVPNGKRITDGIYEFPTGDKSTITVNLLDYFRTFVGTEAGVSAQEKGNSDEKLLGIAEINQGEVADRLGLLNKFYIQFYAEVGDAYLSGLKMCMTERMLIRMIGEDGVESAEITREDLKFSSKPDVLITGGKSEARKNQTLQETKTNALINVAKLFPNVLNPKIAAENLLRNAQWEQKEITPILDPTLDGNEEEEVRASQAIQDVLNKKKPEMYLGATTRFAQKIIDYCDNTKVDKYFTDPMRIGLITYAIAHMKVIDENMARKKMLTQSMGSKDPVVPGGPQPGAVPSPIQNNNGAPVLPTLQK